MLKKMFKFLQLFLKPIITTTYSSEPQCYTKGDKQQRKRSYRRGSHQSDRLHPTHHPIDLSSRTDTQVDEINLLGKGPYPEILIGINVDKTGRHLLTKCDGQIFTLIANILTL